VPRTVLFIVNDPVATPALLADAFSDSGFDVHSFEVVTSSQVDEPVFDVAFPDLTSYDVVVPLGARWPVYDLALNKAWLGTEIAQVRAAHDAGVPILGVCFGGQLLAAALGGSVSRSPSPELGWYDLDTDDSALVPGGPWFQWHFDRWTVPAGATEISRNPRASQAFTLGHSLALQFHPELDTALLTRWLADDRDGDVIRLGLDEAELLTRTAELEADAATRVRALVRGFIARADDSARSQGPVA
jgi:GMP synthase-like glutamine amidotransferase